MLILKEIQYLRAAAVLMVLHRHVFFLSDLLGFSPYFSIMAAAGVDIFFVISGYVVSGVLFRSLILDENANFITNLENNIPRLKAFFVKRVFRLLPVAFLLIFLDIIFKKLGFAMMSQTSATEEIMAFFSHLTMQSDMDTLAFAQHSGVFRNVNHFWSLAVEERFYLLFPMLLIFCASPKKCIRWAVAIIIVLGLLKGLYPFGQYKYAEHETATELYNNGFLCFDAFMFGILIYLLQYYTKVMQKIFSQPRSLAAYGMNFCALLILIVIAREPISQAVLNKGGTLEVWEFRGTAYYYLVVYVLSAILIAMAGQDRGYVLNIPGLRRILLWIGDRSYSIYIFQFFYLGITMSIAPYLHLKTDNNLHLTILYMGVVFIGSELIYHFWENPWRNKGRKIAKQMLAQELAHN